MAVRRILMLTIDYAPQTGGVPHLLRSIVESTHDRVEWRVITAAPGPQDTEQSQHTVIRTGGLRHLPRAALSQRRWLREADSAIVISAHVYLGPLAHVVAKLARVRVSSLAYGRELTPNGIHQRLALRSLRHDHRTITISRNSERLLHQLGVDASRTAWVGTELKPVFPPVMAPLTPRPEGGLELIAVTRLAEGYKNLEVTLRAVAVMADSGLINRYTIVGDGPRYDALHARVDSLGLSDLVSLPRRVDDSTLATLLERSHLGLFPSRDSVAEGGFEGFGIVVQELAAAGLPVVVGDAAGARDAVRLDWGDLVDPDDVAQWVNAIARHARDEPMRFERSARAHHFGSTLDSKLTATRYLEQLLGEPIGGVG